jgi:hypothetical protein
MALNEGTARMILSLFRGFYKGHGKSDNKKPTWIRNFATVLNIAVTVNAGAQNVPYATTISPDILAGRFDGDRGAAGLEQTLHKLNTWASLMRSRRILMTRTATRWRMRAVARACGRPC